MDEEAESERNLSQLYLDCKLSRIDPQSCGLQKKRSPIATGFQDSEGHTPKATGRRHCIRIGGLSAQFWEKNLRAVHSLPLFAKADSDHHVCLDGVAISTVVVAGARGGRI